MECDCWGRCDVQVPRSVHDKHISLLAVVTRRLFPDATFHCQLLMPANTLLELNASVLPSTAFFICHVAGFISCRRKLKEPAVASSCTSLMPATIYQNLSYRSSSTGLTNSTDPPPVSPHPHLRCKLKVTMCTCRTRRPTALTVVTSVQQ